MVEVGVEAGVGTEAEPEVEVEAEADHLGQPVLGSEGQRYVLERRRHLQIIEYSISIRFFIHFSTILWENLIANSFVIKNGGFNFQLRALEDELHECQFVTAL